MTRALPFWAVLTATLATCVTTDLHAECPLPGAEDQERTRLRTVPAAPFFVHEWGVWRLGLDGRVASLEELARESPTFVHRAPEAPGPELGAPLADLDVSCEKPVIFFHTTTAQQAVVTVRFPRGRPWLNYPFANVGRVDGVRAVRFAGQVYPEGVAVGSAGHPPPPVAASHWWSRLRAVNASAFVSAEGAETEGFLFYDGEASFTRGFRAPRGVLTPIAGATENVAWTFDGQSAARLAITGTRAQSTPLASVDALRADMRTTLEARGLTAPEVESLLATWNGNLFTGTTRRVIWMIPRRTYDAMLPIEVWPTPTGLVRVGVVIEQY
jgi:hypothetical protein